MIPCPLTTFVLSYALARGVLASGLLVTAAMAVGMITTVGGVALVATVRARSAGGPARPQREVGDIVPVWRWRWEARRWCFC